MNKYSDMRRPHTSLCKTGHFARSSPALVSTSNSPELNALTGPSNSRPYTLSSLVSLENAKMRRKSDYFMPAAPARRRSELLQLPTQQDFRGLLSKLEKVICSKSSNKRLKLPEGLSMELELDAWDIQYFTVCCREKRTPMRGSLVGLKGRTKVFVSSSVKAPRESACDGVFTQENFSYSDGGSVFSSEYLYIGVFACEDSRFSLTVRFGPDKLNHEWVRHRLHSVAADCEGELFDSLDEAIKSRSPRVRKNFIRKNKTILPLNFRGKGRVWQTRRKDAVLKRDLVLKEKRDKTVWALNKHVALKEEREKLREEQNEFEKQQRKIRDWVGSVYLAKALAAMRQLILEAKTAKIREIEISCSARKIQRIYRKVSLHSGQAQLALSQARNALLFYCSAVEPLTTHHSTISFIRNSFFRASLFSAFSCFHYRVLAIQRVWKQYSFKSQHRVRSLHTLWDRVLLKMVRKAEKLKSKHKRRSLKLYNSIDPAVKSSIIGLYLLEKKKKHLSALRTHSESHTHCTYVPTELKMKSLIRYALST